MHQAGRDIYYFFKNEVNIMMKNVVDVVLGGVTYWAFGYGLRNWVY